MKWTIFHPGNEFRALNIERGPGVHGGERLYHSFIFYVKKALRWNSRLFFRKKYKINEISTTIHKMYDVFSTPRLKIDHLSRRLLLETLSGVWGRVIKIVVSVSAYCTTFFVLFYFYFISIYFYFFLIFLIFSGFFFWIFFGFFFWIFFGFFFEFFWDFFWIFYSIGPRVSFVCARMKSKSPKHEKTNAQPCFALIDDNKPENFAK